MVNSSYLTDPKQFADYQRRLGVSGDNPLRPIIRRAQVGAGDRLLQQIAFGNYLEPGRQSAIQRAIMMAQPGREESLIARNSQAARGARAVYNQDQANADRRMGGGGNVEDMPGNALDPFTGSAMGFRRYVYSPEYQNAQSMNLLGLFGQGQNLDLLDRLTQGQGAIQQSNMMKDQKSGGLLGGITGTIGSLAGAGAFNPFFAKLAGGA